MQRTQRNQQLLHEHSELGGRQISENKQNTEFELEQIKPKLKFNFFPLTRPTLKKGPTQKKLFQFSVKNIFFLNFIAT